MNQKSQIQKLMNYDDFFNESNSKNTKEPTECLF